MYNNFVKYKKGFGKWMFNRFAANPPVFISTVNPEVRVKVTTNLLRDYGYFNGKVAYETIVDKQDSLKAGIVYTVDMKILILLIRCIISVSLPRLCGLWSEGVGCLISVRANSSM